MPSRAKTLYRVTSTEPMDPKRRAAGWYPRRCQKGTCGRPAHFIQRAETADGRKRTRVVCLGCSSSLSWRSE